MDGGVTRFAHFDLRGSAGVTVCIGAVSCDRTGAARRAVVVASDRMVTMGQITQFEHEIPKLSALTDHSVALIAGDALRGTRIIRDTSAQLRGGGAMASIEAITAAIANKYAELRLEQVNNDAFRPRGITLQAFYTGLQQQLNPQIVVGLDNYAATWNFGVELLVAGVDTEGAHLFHIVNPGGTYTQFDHTGFGAIGSGTLHAVQSMIQARHAPTRSLNETVFSVYASKRRAEVAPGVGVDTDMAIIDASGVHPLESDALRELGEIFERYSRPFEADLLADVRKLQLIKDVPQSETPSA